MKNFLAAILGVFLTLGTLLAIHQLNNPMLGFILGFLYTFFISSLFSVLL